MSTRIANLLVANLKTTSKWVDHMVIQCYADSKLTTLVGQKTSTVQWDGTYNNQHQAAEFTGLTYGNTYYIRAGVVTDVNGVTTWSSAYAVVAGSGSTPGLGTLWVAGYPVRTGTGVLYGINIPSPPSDLDTVEIYWNFNGVAPTPSQKPMVKTRLDANKDVFWDVACGAGMSVYSYMRLINTSHIAGAWVLIDAEGITGGNLDNIGDGVVYTRPANVSSDHTFHVSTTLTSQGSLCGIGENNFSYSSSTSSITWSWSAFTIYMPNNTSISVPAGSKAFSGLASSSTYFFSFYYDMDAKVATVVLSDTSAGKGQPSLQQEAWVINADRHIAVAVAIGADTTASGTGGGSGGGGGGGGNCFTPNTKVVTPRRWWEFWKSQRETPIWRVNAGDLVLTRHGFRPVEKVLIHSHRGVMQDMGNGELITPGHHIWHKGAWRPASERFTQRRYFEGSVWNLHIDTVVEDEHNYVLANGVLAHNFIKIV